MRDHFLRWQCRVRQLAMRQGQGKPDDAVTPALRLPDAQEPMGHIITLINRRPEEALLPELKHLAKRTEDPAQRREKALQLLSERYFQKAADFSDLITASFPPGSQGAATIVTAGSCWLLYEAYGQSYELFCDVQPLPEWDVFYQSTWWHNLLFNPNLPPGTVILGFQPQWEKCRANPAPL